MEFLVELQRPRLARLQGCVACSSLKPGIPRPERRPSIGCTVSVHYTGKLIDGTIFDSSYSRGEPVSFPLNGVIAGWTEGLQLMKVGDRYKLIIPPQLGYGERGFPPVIPANSWLVFEVEMVSIQQ